QDLARRGGVPGPAGIQARHGLARWHEARVATRRSGLAAALTQAECPAGYMPVADSTAGPLALSATVTLASTLRQQADAHFGSRGRCRPAPRAPTPIPHPAR